MFRWVRHLYDRSSLEEAAEAALDALLDYKLQLMVKPQGRRSKHASSSKQHPDSFCQCRTAPLSHPAASPPLPLSRSTTVVVKEGQTL
jgi:hypothetical protein